MHETELNMARERIKFCIANSGKSVSMLAGGYGSPMQTKMSRQINFNTMLTFDVIYHVLQLFPDVSAEWLIRGEGQMDKSNHFAPHVHVVGGGSAFINEHGVNIGTQKSDPIIIPTKDELEKLMRSPEGFFSIRTIFDAKDDAIAQRDAIIHTLRDQIAQLTKDKELLSNLLSSLTSQSQSISSDLHRQPHPRQSNTRQHIHSQPNKNKSTNPTSQSSDLPNQSNPIQSSSPKFQSEK